MDNERNQEIEFQKEEEEDILEEIDNEDGDEAEDEGALPSSISAFAAQMEEL